MKYATPQDRKAAGRVAAIWATASPAKKSQDEYRQGSFFRLLSPFVRECLYPAVIRGERSKDVFERLLSGSSGKKSFEDVVNAPVKVRIQRSSICVRVLIVQDVYSPRRIFANADIAKSASTKQCVQAMDIGQNLTSQTPVGRARHYRRLPEESSTRRSGHRCASEAHYSDANEQRSLEKGESDRLWSVSPVRLMPQVKSYLNNAGFRSDCNNQSVCQRDINTLVGPGWLNDEVINMYLVMAQNRSDEALEKGDRGSLKDVYPMSTFFYQKLAEQGYEKSKLARWTKRAKVRSSVN
jgi:hypothetical protein